MKIMKLLISGKAPPTELSWFISRLTRGYGRYITIEGLIHQPITGGLGGLPDKSAFTSGVSRQSVRVLISRNVSVAVSQVHPGPNIF